MRNAFSQEVTELAGQDPRVMLLSGDIGNRLFDRFKEKHPQRFLNAGAAEANMISMAAGMAMAGMRPVAYTIASFITARCLEQIRVDLCYHHQPVVIVGVGGGLSYASLGATHHSCEDIAMLRVMPNMKVVCPADQIEVKLALRAALAQDDPVYIRLGKKGEPKVHTTPPPFTLGKAIVVRKGADVSLLATGNMVPSAVEAAAALEARGISAEVVSFHTVKPLDTELLSQVFESRRCVFTVEEHSVLGGLGGSVAEWRCDQRDGLARLVRIGTSDSFLHEAGEQEHARERYGLSVEQLVHRVESALGERGLRKVS